MSTFTTQTDSGKSGLTMLRRLMIIALAISMVLALVPTSTLAAGQQFHFRFAGKGAEAGWTNCPTQPEAGVVCTDTFLFTAEEVFKEDGSSFQSTTLFMDQISYKFDRKGNFIFVSESFGFGEATLLVDQNLNSASVSATVPLFTCTVDRKGNFTCAEGGSATVNASWTGTGDLVRVNDNYHAVSKGFTYNAHFRGKFREASASGQVNGSDVGTQFFAQILEVRSGEVFVCHGEC